MEKQRVLSVDGRTGLGGAGRQDPGLGMKWYNFLIIALILGALLNIVEIILFIIAQFYMGINEFPASRTCDIVYGFSRIGITVFQVYVWWQLKIKTRKAPLMILLLHGISLFFDVVYGLCMGFIAGNVYVELPIVLADLALGISIVGLSYIYFSKRKHLFVN